MESTRATGCWGMSRFSCLQSGTDPDVRILFDAIEKLHINFYEDNMGLDAIAARVEDAKALLKELNTLRDLPPRPITLDSRERRRRWRRLTGELLPMGSEPDAPPPQPMN